MVFRRFAIWRKSGLPGNRLFCKIAKMWFSDCFSKWQEFGMCSTGSMKQTVFQNGENVVFRRFAEPLKSGSTCFSERQKSDKWRFAKWQEFGLCSSTCPSSNNRLFFKTAKIRNSLMQELFVFQNGDNLYHGRTGSAQESGLKRFAKWQEYGKRSMFCKTVEIWQTKSSPPQGGLCA